MNTQFLLATDPVVVILLFQTTEIPKIMKYAMSLDNRIPKVGFNYSDLVFYEVSRGFAQQCTR